jgi:hypothetical protein
VEETGDIAIGVFVGVDVGKAAHNAVALVADGRVLLDRSLPQDETRLAELITELKGHGRVLFVVDQPATIGALPLAGRPVDGSRGGLPAWAGHAPDR